MSGHSDAVPSTVTSQRDCPGFESTNWSGLSVHVPRVSLGSSHSPKTSM